MGSTSPEPVAIGAVFYSFGQEVPRLSGPASHPLVVILGFFFNTL
jgi:hypothetical protein